MSQFRYPHISLTGYPNKINGVMHNSLRILLQPFTNFYAASLPDLLVQIQQVTTPMQLRKLVNKVQSRIWNLPQVEQAIARKQLADTLILLVQHTTESSLRLEAAGWLCMFVQAAYISQPGQVFVTLVTAAVHVATKGNVQEPDEQHAYLKMIFDCCWPFRYPYATYTWELFPNNEVFYALAPLLFQEDDSIQDILVAIFAELPSLDDAEIVEYLLPVALAWSTHANPERRQRITTILALMSNSSAQETLSHLQADPDPLVRHRAKRAAEKVRRA